MAMGSRSYRTSAYCKYTSAARRKTNKNDPNGEGPFSRDANAQSDGPLLSLSSSVAVDASAAPSFVSVAPFRCVSDAAVSRAEFMALETASVALSRASSVASARPPVLGGSILRRKNGVAHYAGKCSVHKLCIDSKSSNEVHRGLSFPYQAICLIGVGQHRAGSGRWRGATPTTLTTTRTSKDSSLSSSGRRQASNAELRVVTAALSSACA